MVKGSSLATVAVFEGKKMEKITPSRPLKFVCIQGTYPNYGVEALEGLQDKLVFKLGCKLAGNVAAHFYIFNYYRGLHWKGISIYNATEVRGCIFSRVRPFYEWAVSDLDP